MQSNARWFGVTPVTPLAYEDTRKIGKRQFTLVKILYLSNLPAGLSMPVSLYSVYWLTGCRHPVLAAVAVKLATGY